MLRKGSNRLTTMLVAAAALAIGALLPMPAAAQHKANDNDLEVPTNDMKVVDAGRAKYAQRCSFCHGGDGHGGKGPCLSCGSFKYTGNTNGEIYATIAAWAARWARSAPPCPRRRSSRSLRSCAGKKSGALKAVKSQTPTR
jgi:mono/diheme cytochrome c family protein